ncbi:MAG: cytochrome C oxidase subunit IV family protein [Deltaproteobacteria bacterium]|nr:cytochrome C oxidase subunit IV family protein [Deltaproteobacteria bacterium]
MSEHTEPSFYIKIWGILVGLLAVSVIGPMFGIQWLTLITAFGIALVKAYLVAKNFMHIDVSPKFVTYLMVTCLVFMLMLFAGIAPDVMKAEGSNWQKTESWLFMPAVAHQGAAADEHESH